MRPNRVRITSFRLGRALITRACIHLFIFLGGTGLLEAKEVDIDKDVPCNDASAGYILGGDVATLYVDGTPEIRYAVIGGGGTPEPLSSLKTPLCILIPVGKGFKTEFSVDLPDPLETVWGDIHSLTSFLLPAVIVWGGTEFTRTRFIIVAQVKGKFKVILEEEMAEFSDFDLDGVPEVITPERWNLHADYISELRNVWAFDGDEYVKVGSLRYDKFRPILSDELFKALQKVREKREKAEKVNSSKESEQQKPR